MWIFPTVPEKMLMVLAIIFGAHLMPYSWLYKSKVYLVLSVAIPICSLVVELAFEPYVLALMMLVIEVIFCISLIVENSKLKL
jgi:uncharacterized membrane protein YoaK (UPF0700 family)